FPRARSLDLLDFVPKGRKSIALAAQRFGNAFFDTRAAVQVYGDAPACLANAVDTILGRQSFAVLEAIPVEKHVAAGRHVQPVDAGALRGHEKPRLPAPALQVLVPLFGRYVAVQRYDRFGSVLLSERRDDLFECVVVAGPDDDLFVGWDLGQDSFEQVDSVV